MFRLHHAFRKQQLPTYLVEHHMCVCTRCQQVYPLSTTEAALAPAAANATLARVAAAVGQEAANQLAANAYGHVAYCSVNLEQTCSSGLGRYVSVSLLQLFTCKATRDPCLIL